MLEEIGHPVLKLNRTRINGLELGRLRPGEYRFLTPDELDTIKKEVYDVVKEKTSAVALCS